MIELALKFSVAVFMAASLGAVGLGLEPQDAIAPLRSARFVVRVLIASWVVPPLVALVLLAVVPLDASYGTGLWLLALAPCAPFAPALVALARGDQAATAAVMLVCVVTTVVMMPLILPLAGGVSATPLAIVAPLLLFVLLPLAAGMAIRRGAPAGAARLRRVLDAVTGLAGVASLGLVGVLYGPGIAASAGSLALATLMVFLVTSAVAAHWIGWGLGAARRVVLPIGSCTRNLGAALAPLAAAGIDQRAIVMVAMAIPATIAVGLAAAIWLSVGTSPRVTHG